MFFFFNINNLIIRKNVKDKIYFFDVSFLFLKIKFTENEIFFYTKIDFFFFIFPGLTSIPFMDM